ncbi:MAG: FtsW/RodA/SpoVE family cell cycle protein, partial [Dehalococcoidia bacterium]|nr:FtsW/RodA/SpoVE family cell cycle protein [Dehalococcoidia bacterium]
AATLARDVFGRLLAVGIVSMLLFQVFLNIGVNIRLLPVTGVPLPLISYGGSSLLTVLLSLGILESIIIRQKKIEF